MPEMTIADIIQHNIIQAGDILETGEKTTFVSSGLIGRDPEISSAISGMKRGTTLEVDYLVEPEYTESTVMTDSGTDIVSDKFNEQSLKAHIGFYAKSFGEKSITKVLQHARAEYGDDDDAVLQAVVDHFARYWDLDTQRKVFSILSAMIADNKTNNAADLVAVSTDPFSYDAAVDAMEKRGDNIFNQMKHMFVHSKVAARIQKTENIEDRVDSETGLITKFYNGMQLHVDNILAPVAGKYTSVFAMDGAFVREPIDMEANGMRALEYVRDAKTGDGGGATEVISRSGALLHPSGWDYKKANQAKVSPNMAELAAVENWGRKVSAKQSPIVFLETAE